VVGSKLNMTLSALADLPSFLAAWNNPPVARMGNSQTGERHEGVVDIWFGGGSLLLNT
jgi:hypothetical protein